MPQDWLKSPMQALKVHVVDVLGIIHQSVVEQGDVRVGGGLSLLFLPQSNVRGKIAPRRKEDRK